MHERLEYLEKFEREWLATAGLPRPDRFIICCPQPLRDARTDREWTAARKQFTQRTGIKVGDWHRDLLDRWLKRRPDIVADLFSDRHAEAFCEIDEWKPGLFTPLRDGVRDLRLRRYFDRRRAGRLYVHEAYERRLVDALESFPVILVRGLPGTGKTLTSLAVTERFRQGQWRTYFLDVGDEEFTRTQFRDGIKRRLSRPSVFVLENCHHNFAAVQGALEDLWEEMETGRFRVVCLARRAPSSDGSRSDDLEFVLEMEARGAVVDFENDDALLKRLIEFWRPDFEGLSGGRLARLGALCGRNLLLLDEAVHRMESAVEIDTLSPAEMYDRVRRAYFNSRTADEFAATRRLAALAQLDLRPRADVLAIPEHERVVIDSFCVRAGQPPRWHFLHSSAAELVLHALWSGMGVADPEAVAREAARDIIDYFRDLQARERRPPAEADSLERELRAIIQNRLILTGDNGENLLKAAVLDSAPVLELLPKLTPVPTSARTFSLCAFVAHQAGATSASVYAQKLFAVLKNTIQGADRERLPHVLPVLGLFLRILKRVAPLEYDVLARLDARQLLDLIEANGTVLDLFRVVENASPGLARGLLDALDDARVEKLIGKTITTGRTIGTLDLTLRELRRSGETASLAEVLEWKIGPQRFLALIEANGTVFELFSILQHASPRLAHELLDALDDAQVERLIRKTVAERRSIGTLHLTLRALRRSGETASLAEALERKIGPQRFLALIEANGTILELFSVVRYASPDLACGLIETLDNTRVEQLVAKTIAEGRSIGTFNLTLRELHRSSETASPAKALERKVGPQRFLALIEANGTVLDLFSIVRYASLGLARGLIETLDDTRVEKLVAKTIAEGRSIGTLNFALRELHRSSETVSLARALERKIGAQRFLALVEGNGTILELLNILAHVSSDLAHELIDALDDRRVEKLIGKTIAESRSIGTLDLLLRELHRSGETASLARALERKIGPQRFLALIEANGTVFELFMIVRRASPDLARELLDAIDAPQVEKLIGKTIAIGRSIGTLGLTLRHSEVSLAGMLEQKIGVDGFWRLVVGTGSAGALVDLLGAASPGFRDLLLSAARDLSQAQWECILERRGIFSLSRLISTSPMLLESSAGGDRLLQAITGQLPVLIAHGSWYDRSRAAHVLTTCADSKAVRTARQMLEEWLRQVAVENLSFSSLREAVYGISLLYEQHSDAGDSLAPRLRELLPAREDWKLHPGKDVDLPHRLLQLVGEPEFSDADAEYVSAGVLQQLTPALVKQCHTRDLLWILWEMFALARARKGHAAPAFGKSFPAEFWQSLRDRLATNLSGGDIRDELHARFALLGLCSLLNVPVDRSIATTLQSTLAGYAQAGAWWLTAGRTFVSAWLVLRGLATARPFSARLEEFFLHRLLEAADEYGSMGPAAEYLYEDVRRRLEKASGTRWATSASG